jgi:hypothetical protein
VSRRLAVAAALLVVAIGWAPAARAEITGTEFRSSTWGVDLVAPRGWELSEQSSYPGIIVRGIEHKGSGRLSLAAQRLAPGDSAKALAARSEAGLKKVGYKVAAATTHPSGAVLLEGTTRDGQRTVRQAYLDRNGVTYVLSVACAAADSARYLHPFDDILRNLSFSEPVAPGGP